MKIVIVGAGASGLLEGILIKQRKPDYDITIIDQCNKIGKKLYATGNGKCNIGNSTIIDKQYNNEFAKELAQEFSFAEQKSFFESIGLQLKMIGNLCYPYSENAKTVVDFLTNKLISLGVHIILETHVIDYKLNGDQYLVFCSGKVKTILADKLIIMTGGKSNPNLGSDGSMFPLLHEHGYNIISLYPGLVPLHTKENTKLISGVRAKAEITLMDNDDALYTEQGELLFKDNGLSGIAIMNCSSIYARRIKAIKRPLIRIDFFPNMSVEDVANRLKTILDNNYHINILDGFLPKSLSQFIFAKYDLKTKDKYTYKELLEIAGFSKNLIFHITDLYDFKDSQVTIGGISLDNVEKSLCSKKEKNVYFGGEILNIDGLCGGYNLMLYFASAMRISQSF